MGGSSSHPLGLMLSIMSFFILHVSHGLRQGRLAFPISNMHGHGQAYGGRGLPAFDVAHIPMKDFVRAGMALQRCHLLLLQRSQVTSAASYEGECDGEFYSVIDIGTPPQRAIFILDTGSELTWLQCAPCKSCSVPTHPYKSPLFRTVNSSSYFNVSWGSYLCTPSLGFSINDNDANTNTNTDAKARSCVFSISYADGTIDSGYLAVERFHASSSTTIDRLVFGCAHKDTSTTYFSLASSGLMGLNAGPFSFVSQLFQATGYARKFCYCMPDRIHNLHSNGTLIFGEAHLHEHYHDHLSLSYTPLSPPFPPLASLFYYLNLEGITVNHKEVMQPPHHYVATILDSGTLLTKLVEPSLKAVLKAMMAETKHLGPFSLDHSSTLCYNMSALSRELPDVPSIAFHFEGGATLDLAKDSILFPVAVDDATITVCLAFALADGFTNVIGNYQQQNYWVEHDLEEMRIGFAKANCARDSAAFLTN